MDNAAVWIKDFLLQVKAVQDVQGNGMISELE